MCVAVIAAACTALLPISAVVVGLLTLFVSEAIAVFEALMSERCQCNSKKGSDSEP